MWENTDDREIKTVMKNLIKKGVFPTSSCIEEAVIKFNERSEEKNTKELLKLIQDWDHLCLIFRRRLGTYQQKYLSKASKKEISKFEEAHLTLSIFSSEITRLLQASVLCVVAGYSESAFIATRHIIERSLQSQFFALDFQSLGDWRSGKLKLRMTGKGGLIEKLSDPKFVRSKSGFPGPLIMEEDLKKAVEGLFKHYSEAVHGKALGSTDIFMAGFSSKTIGEFGRRLEEIEHGYMELFLKTMKPILDLIGLMYLTIDVFLSRAKVLEDIDDDEKRLQEILPTFPECRSFINGYRRKLVEKKKNKNKK